MSDDGLTPERIDRIIDAAVNPHIAFRDMLCRRLVRQIHAQFGIDGLAELLQAIDEQGKFASMVLADRGEVDNYIFEQYGVFDEYVFEDIQLTERWSEFLEETGREASQVLGEIIDEILDVK